MAGGAPVEPEHLPPGLSRGVVSPATRGGEEAQALLGESLSLREIERRAILAAMERCEGNRSKAARLLEIDRSTLRRKLQEFGIDAKR